MRTIGIRHRAVQRFTLLELVVVLTMLGIVTAVTIPAFKESQQYSRVRAKQMELAGQIPVGPGVMPPRTMEAGRQPPALTAS